MWSLTIRAKTSAFPEASPRFPYRAIAREGPRIWQRNLRQSQNQTEIAAELAELHRGLILQRGLSAAERAFNPQSTRSNRGGRPYRSARCLDRASFAPVSAFGSSHTQPSPLTNYIYCCTAIHAALRIHTIFFSS